MVKSIIIYDSKYGNTRQVAETIAGGMEEIPGVEAVVRRLAEVDTGRVREYDAVLIGSPNHMGNATRSTRKLINDLPASDLEGKPVAVFDTYIGGDFEKAVKKMEKMLANNIPGFVPALPGLSVKVSGMKGPITEGDLASVKEFGARFAFVLKQQA